MRQAVTLTTAFAGPLKVKVAILNIIINAHRIVSRCVESGYSAGFHQRA